MRLRDHLASAAASLLAHRLRTALAALGIVIGVAATIALAMAMEALAGSLNKQFEGLGARTLTARADTSFQDTLRGNIHHLRGTDLDALRRYEPRAVDLTPLLAVSGTFGAAVSARGRTAFAKVYGTTASYSRLHHLY